MSRRGLLEHCGRENMVIALGWGSSIIVHRSTGINSSQQGRKQSQESYCSCQGFQQEAARSQQESAMSIGPDRTEFRFKLTRSSYVSGSCAHTSADSEPRGLSLLNRGTRSCSVICQSRPHRSRTGKADLCMSRVQSTFVLHHTYLASHFEARLMSLRQS